MLRECQADIPYTVRRSARARRVRVAVHAHDDVEVVLPAGAPEQAAAAAVRELAPWISRRLAEARSAREAVGRRPGVVPYLGGTPARGARPGRTRVHAGAQLLAPGGGERGPGARALVRRAARVEVSPRLDRARADGDAVHGAHDPRPAHALGELLAQRGA